MKKYLLTLIILHAIFNSYGQCWQSIAVDQYAGFGLQKDSSIWAWGEGHLKYNNYLDSTLPETYLPQSTNTDKWIDIAAGQGRVIAINKKGKMFACGISGYSSGYVPNTILNKLTLINADTNWESIKAVDDFAVAKKTNGTLWATGRNDYGQCGLGHNNLQNTFAKIGIDTDWSSYTADNVHCLAIKKNGTLWAWGANGLYILGDNTTIDRLVPVQIGTDSNWFMVAAGNSNSLAIKKDGTLWGWGVNGLGSLASVPIYPYYLTTITKLDSANDWVYVYAYDNSTWAIKQNGTLWACGESDGKLGDSTSLERDSFVQIAPSIKWAKISNFDNTVFGISKTGELYTWGNNQSGQCGYGYKTNGKAYPQMIGNFCGPLSNQQLPIVNQQFTIYPNPTNTTISLDVGTTTKQQLYISNAAGQQVYTQFIVNAQTRIDVSRWASGVYYVRYGVSVQKLVVGE
jgi:alpha-tubulin suppressor-like RCC1 family protein